MISRKSAYSAPKTSSSRAGLCCCICFGMAFATAHSQDAAPVTAESFAVSAADYQAGFESIYEAWRSAMQQQDLAAWKAITATYRQREISNRIVSQKQAFPTAMFAVPVSAPQLAPLSLVNIYVKKSTATTVYFGKLDFGTGPAAAAGMPDSFLVLRFAGEGDQWKFDNLRVIKFGGDSDLLLKMRQGDLTFLDSPEFQPSGEVPPVAAEVGTPDYLAELWVSAIGYKATVDINDHHHSEVINNTGRDLVIGGLHRGDNKITIRVEADPNADPSVPKHLEVGIYAAARDDQAAERVYHHRAEPNVLASPFIRETIRVK